MNDFDRRLGSALKRVRDEHAASDPDLRRDMLRRGKRRRTLRLTGAAAGAVAVLVLGATTIPILRDEAAPGPAGERQPTVTETFDISSPAAMVANDDNVWVASQDGLMSRIDTKMNDVVEGGAALSRYGVKDMALGPGGIWAAAWTGDIGPGGEAQSDLQIVDPESMEVIEEPFFPNRDTALYSVTAGEQGTVWAVNAAADQVFKMRPEAEALREIPTGRFPVDVVAAAGGVWVSNSRSGTITEIDARAPITHTDPAGDVVGEFPVECPGDLVIAFGSLWVTNFCENQIRRIDLSGPSVVANVPTGKGPHALVEAGGYIWVVNTLDETVVRVDPSTNRVIGDPVDVGASPESIVSSGGAVWVANRGDDTVSRIDYRPQPDPDFTPLPTPSPSPTPTPTPAPPSPTPSLAEGFAIWPETSPARAEAACGSNAPAWRADATEVGLRFAREAIGWPDATNPDAVQLRKSGGAVMSISRSQGEPDVRVIVSVAPTLFEGGCLSVVRVSSPGPVANALLELVAGGGGGIVTLQWEPRDAASAEAIVGFGELEQVKEVTAPRARFVFDAPPTEPGFFLVLLKDDGGEVISAMGKPLPARDLNAG